MKKHIIVFTFFAASFVFFRVMLHGNMIEQVMESEGSRALSVIYLFSFFILLGWFFTELSKRIRRDISSLAKPVLFSLLFILVLTLFLRFYGITYGLPYKLHIDEPVNTYRGEKMLRHPDMILPDSFHYPSMLYYLIFVGSTLQNAYDNATSQEYILNQSNYTINRSIIALLNSLTVLLLFLGVIRLGFSPQAAILTACIAATSPLLVTVAHQIIPESPLLFFLVATFWLTFHELSEEEPKLFIVGVATGFTLGSKFNGMLIILLPLAVMAMKHRPANPMLTRRNLGLFFSGFMIAFILSCPVCLLYPEGLINDFSREVSHYLIKGHPGYEGMNRDLNILHQGEQLFWRHLGPLASIMTVIGLIFGLCKRRQLTLILSIVPVTTFTIAGLSKVTFDRILLPALPFLAIFAGMVLDQFIKKIRKRTDSPPWLLAWMVLSLVIAAYPAYLSITDWQRAMNADTRQLSTEWILKNVDSNALIAINTYGPQPQIFGYKTVEINEQSDEIKKVREYRKLGVRYIALSEWNYGRWITDYPKSKTGKAYKRLMNQLVRNNPGNPVATFIPTLEHPGPTIQIYKVRNLPKKKKQKEKTKITFEKQQTSL